MIAIKKIKNLRSNAIRAIIDTTPGWLISYGSIVILLMLLIILYILCVAGFFDTVLASVDGSKQVMLGDTRGYVPIISF